MKKIISIILAGAMILSLAACGTTTTSSLETKRVTLVGQINGADVDYRIEGTGDVAKKITQVMTTDISMYDENTIRLRAAEVQLEYALVAGLEYTYSISNGVLTETFVMDLSTPENISSLAGKGLVDNALNAESVSIQKTIDNMKAQGFTEKY